MRRQKGFDMYVRSASAGSNSSRLCMPMIFT